MKKHPPSYLTRVVRNGRRRRRRRQWASAVLIVLVLAAVVGVAIYSLEGNKATSSTSTSVTQAAASTPATTVPAPTTTSTAGTPAIGPAVYKARLSGQEEVPAVSSRAQGALTLTMAANGASVDALLQVTTITDVTVARLHEGRVGANGPTILTLYAGPGKSGAYTGVLTQSTFGPADLEGPLKGKQLADLVALVKVGQVYLNVGTRTHVQGEIRGQVK